MSTKALKTQLLAAVAMVLVASVALGSSTYAWFANNNKVTADGLQVSAKTDNTFLLISNTSSEDTVSAVQTSAKTNVTETKTGEAVQVKPSAPITKASKSTVHEDTISDYSAAGSWYQASAATVTASAAKVDTEERLTSMDGFVVQYSYNLCLAKGSTDAKDLKASCTFTKTGSGVDSTMNPVRVIVVCGGNAEEFAASHADAATGIAGTKTLASTVTDSALTNVKVYVYYDGTDDAVYTNNSANLAGAGITLDFSVNA